MLSSAKFKQVVEIDWAGFLSAAARSLNNTQSTLTKTVADVEKNLGIALFYRTSRDLDLWAYANDVTLDFSRPGKPTDNAFIESFNGPLRAECLNAHWFMSLGDAREKLERWRRDCKEVRLHSAIGNNVPISLVHRPDALSPSEREKAKISRSR